ncbi:TrkH family potassium uptake protein [bacterium]|nr:TrkH family potassium uptake protein [bacterium]
MNLYYVFNAISIILRYASILLMVPCICAIWQKEYMALIPFIIISLVSLGLGVFLKNKIKEDELNNINRTEAFAIVLLTWGLLCILGSVPFMFFGMTPVDSLFESVSGLTATGATVLKNFDIYPNTMFFWRSYSQWLGGMGIIVLFTAVLPQFSIAGRQMFFAEVPGSTESKLTPRIRQTAGALWGIYLFLTLAEVAMLVYLKMPVFDAICTSMSTISAGGFSPKADSLIAYGSVKYVWTVAAFMFFAGFNFALQYKVFVKRKIMSLFKDEEFKLYVKIVLIFALLLAIALTSGKVYTFMEALREAIFQVLAIMTTTGFACTDYSQWTLGSKMLLFILMFTGASIGSATGGIKLLRILIIFKYLKLQIAKIHHPNGVYPIKINRSILNEQAVRQIISFVIFYYLIFAITSVILVIIEQNLTTGITASIATLGNIGPGFGEMIGPMGSYGDLHISSKLITTFNMFIGRLELIPFLSLLHPDFWSIKKNNNLQRQ